MALNELATAYSNNLFCMQGLHRIEARSAPSREHAGDDCHKKQKNSDRCKDAYIQRLGLIEHAAKQPRSCDASGESDREAH